MKILGIETSCDETAAAIVTADKKILSNVVHSQTDHEAYGGVVPEIASRAHLEYLDIVITKALQDARMEIGDVDAIAVTAGPGLIGGVMVGVLEAKAIASSLQKPIIAVNHLEAHALTARLTDDVEFPYLLLLVSGGHCQILEVRGVGNYKLIGETLDDAVGESFDKLAKMLGLGLPGGPKIEQLAKQGNENAFELPRPLWGQGAVDFSFSGLKTAVKKRVESRELRVEDICVVFQKTVADILCERIKNSISILDSRLSTLVIAGGVAANQYIRNKLSVLCRLSSVRLVAPPLSLCTDNAAMIAWAGIEKLKLGHKDNLNFVPRARWPLVELKV